MSFAQASLFPQINGEGTATHNKLSQNAISNNRSSSGKPFDNIQAGLSLNWELDLFGRVLRAVEAEEAALQLSVEDARSVTISLVAEIGFNYINLRGYQKQLQAQKDSVQSWDYVYKLNQDLLKAGLATEIDMLQAKTGLDDAKSRIPPLEAAIKETMHHLAILTGNAPTALYASLEETKPVPEIPNRIFGGLPSELVARRPDIRAADAAFARSNAEVGVAIGALFPSFSLTGNYTYSSQKGSNLFTSRSISYGYGPSFTWPIIDFGRINATIDASVANRNGQFYQYKNTVLKALEEVENALVNYSKEQERMVSLKQAFDASKQASDLSVARYEAGRINFIQTLQAQITYQLNRVSFYQSQTAAALNAISVYRALGGGWQPFDADVLKKSEQTPEVAH